MATHAKLSSKVLRFFLRTAAYQFTMDESAESLLQSLRSPKALPFSSIKASTVHRERVAPLLIQELQKFAADFQGYDRNDLERRRRSVLALLPYGTRKYRCVCRLSCAWLRRVKDHRVLALINSLTPVIKDAYKNQYRYVIAPWECFTGGSFAAGLVRSQDAGVMESRGGLNRLNLIFWKRCQNHETDCNLCSCVCGAIFGRNADQQFSPKRGR